MLIGTVSGSLWATRKNEKLNGLKFLLVDIEADEKTSTPQTLVAADNAGAGFGDMVLVTMGGSARVALDDPETPVDAVIVGIIDSVERQN
ncbi:EutN/CcmL family microcompartment protein [Vagococcus sp. PNs007]|uniref:Ethanolamine utilization protein EutN n=2 Tax=Vagococcus TaxID=2737 RepID=A0A430AC51_9ENTE|nr:MULTISPECIES: EutN/CcmL family microcompartment protein [Vagococcus]MDF0479140.1 EutN/CcmL family microcompartment protein [Vagococcus proximus]RSU04795.1 ethanolamine utilization protein EutN [Vagococcus fessus]